MEINSYIVSGFICSDPEYEVTQSGLPRLKFRLGTPRVTKDKNAENYENQFFNVVLFRDIAKKWSESNLKRGSQVFVVGKLENRSYPKQDGSTGISSDILACDMGFMPNKKPGGSNGNGNGYGNGNGNGNGNGQQQSQQQPQPQQQFQQPSGPAPQLPGTPGLPGGIPGAGIPGMGGAATNAPAVAVGAPAPAPAGQPPQQGGGLMPPPSAINAGIPADYDPFAL